MRCLKCGGSYSTMDTKNSEKNEIFRRKRCKLCGNLVYTKEVIVDYDDIKRDFLDATKYARMPKEDNND